MLICISDTWDVYTTKLKHHFLILPFQIQTQAFLSYFCVTATKEMLKTCLSKTHVWSSKGEPHKFLRKIPRIYKKTLLKNLLSKNDSILKNWKNVLWYPVKRRVQMSVVCFRQGNITFLITKCSILKGYGLSLYFTVTKINIYCDSLEITSI